MIMKVVFAEKSILMFKKCMDMLKESLESVNLECRKTGLFVNSMNVSQTGVLQMFIAKTGMEEYDGGKYPTMGIRLDTFQKCLKSLSASKSLTLELKQEILKAYGIGKYSVLMEFKLDDVPDMKQDVDIEYDATCTLDAKMFYGIIKDLNNVGNTVNISVVDGVLSFESEGIDVGRTKIVVDDLEDLDVEHGTGPINLKFGIVDLLKYAKVCSIAESVKLHIKDGKPICLHYTLNNEFGWFRCFLAPML